MLLLQFNMIGIFVLNVIMFQDFNTYNTYVFNCQLKYTYSVNTTITRIFKLTTVNKNINF